MAGRSKSPHRGPWIRGIAVLGLVAYLGGMGWFMTLCTAALAVVDGEHSVRIEFRQQDFFQLVEIVPVSIPRGVGIRSPRQRHKSCPGFDKSSRQQRALSIDVAAIPSPHLGSFLVQIERLLSRI